MDPEAGTEVQVANTGRSFRYHVTGDGSTSGPMREGAMETLRAKVQGFVPWCKRHSKAIKTVFMFCWLVYIAVWLTYWASHRESNASDVQKHFINIGMRQDYLLQECQGTEFKQSFPDLDYAFMGYNILRGFPLAPEHDPGFTYPIFVADYKHGRQTADCRYSIPQGVAVVPDVSCITSFTSTIAETQYEYASSLSVSASVSGGGWGASFSASAGYKESSSEISTGESVYIISSAKCNYYFSKLTLRSLPPLDPVFKSWIKILSNTDSEDTYIEFLDTYGTHFPTEVTFGARFTYEHKMKSSEYQKQTESSVNVGMSASYSGAASVGASFSMDSSQQEKARNFAKSVETRTISVGAPPPANGDALTWASTVKTSPVPSSYKLLSIEELFTDKYMNENYMDEAGLDINLKHIADTITKTKQKYCEHLKTRGEVDECQPLVAGLRIPSSLLAKASRQVVSTYHECVKRCLKFKDCIGINYCDKCSESRKTTFYRTCYIYTTDIVISGEQDEDWNTMIFTDKLKRNLVLSGTEVLGTERKMNESRISSADCEKLCKVDAHCIAYTYNSNSAVVSRCKMYSFDNVKGLKKDLDTKTVFVAKMKN